MNSICPMNFFRTTDRYNDMETRLKRTIDLAPAVQRLGKTTDYRANFQGELVEMARFLGSRQSF